MKLINKEIVSLMQERETNKELYIKPLSKKITALKKLLDQQKRRNKI
jgi:hypothetical protein